MFKTELLEFKDGRARFGTKVPISANVFKDEDTGFLYCKNSILGNTGVQKYYGKEIGLQDEQADQVIEMIRDAQDVFDEESMSTYEGKPVTLMHPKGKVTSKNYKKFTVGSLKDAKASGENIEGDIVLYDEYTIDKVVNGELKDLSLGYSAKVVQMADGRYKQTDIKINHLAIVEDGRAVNARIVDENTVSNDEKDKVVLKPKDFSDKVHVTHSKTTTERVNEYDDETGEEKTKEVSTYESTHSHYEKMKQQLIDSKNKKQGENQMEKDFKYYMAELKDMATYPKGEFRDKAYDALFTDCKETLGVELPKLADLKDSAIAKSVGLNDSKKDLNDDNKEKEQKTLTIYAKDEEQFFKNLYRSMDDPEVARKYASMDYNDVLNAMIEGRAL